jgi:two-component system nitrogen regulation sensor histidine kinase NtrY
MTSIASAERPTPAEIAATPPNLAMQVLGPVASALAMLSAFATFVVLADLTPIAPTHTVVVTLLLINALTVFLLLGIIGREVWMVVQARRRGRAAARLHVRIVALFAVIAGVPAILVALVASVTLDRGLDRLFSTRTRAIIENSLIVADAYLQEQARMIRGDIMAMSFDVARAKPLFDGERERF